MKITKRSKLGMLFSSAFRLLNQNIERRKLNRAKDARRLALKQVPGAGVPDPEAVRHQTAIGGRRLKRRQMSMARAGGMIVVRGGHYTWAAC